MLDKYSQKIDQAIVEISGFAHMPLEETREFVYLYLDEQFKGQDLDDKNIEGVFTNTAQELKISIDELKTKIYDILSKQTLFAGNNRK